MVRRGRDGLAGGLAVSDAGRTTDRAALPAEVGVPARHKRLRVTHTVTLRTIYT
jgi:hypothetical protein